MKVLAGDIGGTHSRLLYAEVVDATVTSIAEEVFSSHAYTGLIPVINAFLNNQPDCSDIQAACFAVAGPVTGDTASITNLPWVIERTSLAKILGLTYVRLVNDFQGVGYGLDALSAGDLRVLQQGTVQPHAPRVLLGAGTGFGQGIQVWQQDHYEVLASEGGHVDFAPHGKLQMELLGYLLASQSRVSYDDLLSGRGVVSMCRFLAETGRGKISAGMQQDMDSGDPAAVISRHALQENDALAVATLDLFADIYASQAGNVALSNLARGGVYIAGGIAPKILPMLTDGRFIQTFCDKPPMQTLLASMPVQVVLNTRVGLLGAALAASCI